MSRARLSCSGERAARIPYTGKEIPFEGVMNLQFDLVCAADAETLLHMARAFHQEDGHPLDSEGEMAVAQIATGEPFARSWIVRQAGDAIGYVVLTLGYSIEY